MEDWVEIKVIQIDSSDFWCLFDELYHELYHDNTGVYNKRSTIL